MAEILSPRNEDYSEHGASGKQQGHSERLWWLVHQLERDLHQGGGSPNPGEAASAKPLQKPDEIKEATQKHAKFPDWLVKRMEEPPPFLSSLPDTQNPNEACKALPHLEIGHFGHN